MTKIVLLIPLLALDVPIFDAILSPLRRVEHLRRSVTKVMEKLDPTLPIRS